MYRIPDRIKHFAVLAPTVGLPKPPRIAARTRLLSGFQMAKVRRGQVGGCRDFFTDEQAARMEDMVRTHLSPALGYAAFSIGLRLVADGG